MNLLILYYLAYGAALFLMPWVCYSLILNTSKRRSVYSNRDWFYFIKYLFAKSAVKQFQNKCARSVTRESLKKLENVIEVKSDKYTDSQFIYGIDQNGNSLSVRIVIHSELLAEVFLCLRISGDVYTFPGDKVTLYPISNWQWKTQDLCLEILEPFKRLRLTFNGLLAKSTEIEHVQFNFIWTSGGTPKFYPQDSPTAPLADALASEYWRSGDWIIQIGDERGYEQFGTLRGLLKGDSFSTEQELCLASCRTRFWGTAEQFAIKRSLHFFVVAKNGTLFSIWAKAIRNGCSQLRYGNALLKSGDIYSIQNTDLRLQFLGKNKTVPPAFTLHIKVNRKEYKCIFHTRTTENLRAIYPEFKGYELINTPAYCSVDAEQGQALVEFWYNFKGSGVEKPQPIIREITQNISSNYAVNLQEPDARIVRLTGGKGSSLAWLKSFKSNTFEVPEGFVVTVNAFNQQLDIDFNLKKAIAILDDICCGRTKGNLEDACSETVKQFKNCSVLPQIQLVITEELRKLDDGTRWAIRSSGIGEDSEDLSQAGQNETFLGFKSDDVVEAVASCWASLFTYQSVKYRHQHGIPVKSEMAVVVQKMVASDISGVLFTCHPATSNPANMVVTSNYGLGESVVSGRSDPDTIVIKRHIDGRLEILSQQIGLKNRIVKQNIDGNGTVEILPNWLEQKLSLSDDQILKLGQIGVELERKFGTALDIEWAFVEEQLYLLQSRPVTTLKSWSDYELEHEFDIATFSDSIYTVANTGEVFPGAQSTLTLTTIVPIIDLGMQYGLNSTLDMYKLKNLPTFQHFVFIDVINSIHKNPTKNPTLTSKILDLAVFGHPVFNDQIQVASVGRWGIKGIELIKETLRMFRIAYNNEKILQKLKKNAQNFDFGISDRDTVAEIYNKIDQTFNWISTEIFQYHCNISGTSVFYQVLALTVLAERNEDFNLNHYNDITALFSSCEEVVSAKVPTILENIAQLIKKADKFEEFRQLEPSVALKWLPKNCPEAGRLFNEFLKEYGHRSLGEFDLLQENWAMNPAQILKMIQANSAKLEVKPQKSSETLNEIIANLTSPTSELTRKILKFLMVRCRRTVGTREQSKSESIWVVNKLRHTYIELSRRMALEGLIPSSKLIFHLSHDEIRLIIEKNVQSPILVSKALRRQRLHKQWKKLRFPEISYSTPKPMETILPSIGREGGKIKCEGTPVCSGVIEARACVITSIDEIDQLQEGDILITYCTDIGWSPYFPLLSGVVTELGGLVSHGAVVAREYGLPCIVGVPNVTKLFQTGDTVILSGKNGTIQSV